MNIGWKKAVSVGLCTCLALTGLSGCSKKESFDAAATAITVNDGTVSAGLLKFAVHYMQSQYETMYANYGYTGIINQDIYGTGSTLGDSIKDGMVEELTHLLLAEQHMEEYGLSLSDEQKKAASDAAAAFIADNDAEIMEKMAADQETVERYLELVTMQSMVEDAMTADVDTEVSDEEAAQRKIQYTLFTVAAEKESETEENTEDVSEAVSEAAEEMTEADTAKETEVQTESGSEAPETAALTENDTAKTQSAAETETEAPETDAAEGSTEATEAIPVAETESETETEAETEDAETREARAKAKLKAEALIEKLKAGEDFETASSEVDSNAYCGTTTFGADDESRKELIAATDGLADGTLVETPVETSTGFYVVRLETQVDREATDQEKENIVNERKNDRITELYEEWESDSEISSDSDVISKIVFDFSLAVQSESEADTEAEDITEAVTEYTPDAAESENLTESATEVWTESTAEAETEAGTEGATEAVTEGMTGTESETK